MTESASTGSAPLIVDRVVLTGADGKAHLLVTPQELERAVCVWLKVMPPHLWRPYQRMLEIDQKRRREGDTVDPRNILAAYIAGQFMRARWDVSHPLPPTLTPNTMQKPPPRD
ncbi:MAG TPA: hypothetical protein VGB54_02515 [Allosphingosinicella sp.]|jgi:hypothetical protein